MSKKQLAKRIVDKLGDGKESITIRALARSLHSTVGDVLEAAKSSKKLDMISFPSEPKGNWIIGLRPEARKKFCSPDGPEPDGIDDGNFVTPDLRFTPPMLARFMNACPAEDAFCEAQCGATGEWVPSPHGPVLGDRVADWRWKEPTRIVPLWFLQSCHILLEFKDALGDVTLGYLADIKNDGPIVSFLPMNSGRWYTDCKIHMSWQAKMYLPNGRIPPEWRESLYIEETEEMFRVVSVTTGHSFPTLG